MTIADIAKLAQVSQATVSRTINNKPTVKEKNRRKVERVIREVGFKANKWAQELARRRAG